MGFLRNNRGSLISESFILLRDAETFKKDFMIDVSLFEDHLTLKPMLSKNIVTLQYSQITDVFYGMETEIVTKEKSPIARAAVGGLLFGGAGAVVGAVSGIGEKQKSVNKFYFIISYTDSNGNDTIMHFEDTRLYKGRKLAERLKEKAER